jgi:hypothetical protein
MTTPSFSDRTAIVDEQSYLYDGLTGTVFRWRISLSAVCIIAPIFIELCLRSLQNDVAPLTEIENRL